MPLKINLKNPVDKVKQVAQNAKEKLQAAADKAKEVLNKGKEAAALAMFAPFAPLAVIYLLRKGITPSKNMRDLALQIHNERTKKSFGWVEGGDAFDYGPYVENDPGEIDLIISGTANYGVVPITPEMVMAAITFLKGIFDTIKAKKEQGKELSADEQAIADQAAALQQQIGEAQQAAQTIVANSESKATEVVNAGVKEADKEIAKADKEDKEDNFFEKNWKIILAMVILVVLFIWFKTR